VVLVLKRCLAFFKGSVYFATKMAAAKGLAEM